MQQDVAPTSAFSCLSHESQPDAAAVQQADSSPAAQQSPRLQRACVTAAMPFVSADLPRPDPLGANSQAQKADGQLTDQQGHSTLPAAGAFSPADASQNLGSGSAVSAAEWALMFTREDPCGDPPADVVSQQGVYGPVLNMAYHDAFPTGSWRWSHARIIQAKRLLPILAEQGRQNLQVLLGNEPHYVSTRPEAQGFRAIHLACVHENLACLDQFYQDFGDNFAVMSALSQETATDIGVLPILLLLLTSKDPNRYRNAFRVPSGRHIVVTDEMYENAKKMAR